MAGSFLVCGLGAGAFPGAALPGAAVPSVAIPSPERSRIAPRARRRRLSTRGQKSVVDPALEHAPELLDRLACGSAGRAALRDAGDRLPPAQEIQRVGLVRRDAAMTHDEPLAPDAHVGAARREIGKRRRL